MGVLKHILAMLYGVVSGYQIEFKFLLALESLIQVEGFVYSSRRVVLT